MAQKDRLDGLQSQVKELKDAHKHRMEEIKDVRKNYIPPGFTPETYPHALQNFNERWDEWKKTFGVKEVAEVDRNSTDQINVLITELINESL